MYKTHERLNYVLRCIYFIFFSRIIHFFIFGNVKKQKALFKTLFPNLFFTSFFCLFASKKRYITPWKTKRIFLSTVLMAIRAN